MASAVCEIILDGLAPFRKTWRLTPTCGDTYDSEVLDKVVFFTSANGISEVGKTVAPHFEQGDGLKTDSVRVQRPAGGCEPPSESVPAR